MKATLILYLLDTEVDRIRVSVVDNPEVMEMKAEVFKTWHWNREGVYKVAYSAVLEFDFSKKRIII